MMGNFTADPNKHYEQSPNSTLKSNKTEDDKDEATSALHIGMFENQAFNVDGLNFYN